MAYEYRRLEADLSGSLAVALQDTADVIVAQGTKPGVANVFAALPTDYSTTLYLPLVIADDQTGAFEIVWVIGHASGSSSLRVERAREGTLRQSFSAGAVVRCATTLRDETMYVATRSALPTLPHYGLTAVIRDESKTVEFSAAGWIDSLYSLPSVATRSALPANPTVGLTVLIRDESKTVTYSSAGWVDSLYSPPSVASRANLPSNPAYGAVVTIRDEYKNVVYTLGGWVDMLYVPPTPILGKHVYTAPRVTYYSAVAADALYSSSTAGVVAGLVRNTTLSDAALIDTSASGQYRLARSGLWVCTAIAINDYTEGGGATAPNNTGVLGSQYLAFDSTIPDFFGAIDISHRVGSDPQFRQRLVVGPFRYTLPSGSSVSPLISVRFAHRNPNSNSVALAFIVRFDYLGP